VAAALLLMNTLRIAEAAMNPRVQVNRNATFTGMYRIAIAGLIFGVLVLTAGCLGSGDDGVTPTPTPVHNQIIRSISVHEAYFLLEANAQNPNFILIDLRRPDEIQYGYIEGMVNVNYQADDFARQLGALDRNKRYMIYDGGGVRSLHTQHMMEQMGFLEVYSIQGGFEDWKLAGYPIMNPQDEGIAAPA
jgi:rhodanese-related sulfurtransferase